MIKTKSREERRQIVLSLQDELKVELISSYDDYEDTMDENREHKSEQQYHHKGGYYGEKVY